MIIEEGRLYLHGYHKEDIAKRRQMKEVDHPKQEKDQIAIESFWKHLEGGKSLGAKRWMKWISKPYIVGTTLDYLDGH